MRLPQPWWRHLEPEASLNKNISAVRMLAEFMLQQETKCKQAATFPTVSWQTWLSNPPSTPPPPTTHCCLFTSVCLSFMSLIVLNCKPTIYFNSNLSEEDAVIRLRPVSDDSANHIRIVHSLCLPSWKTSPQRNAGSGPLLDRRVLISRNSVQQ